MSYLFCRQLGNMLRLIVRKSPKPLLTKCIHTSRNILLFMNSVSIAGNAVVMPTCEEEICSLDEVAVDHREHKQSRSARIRNNCGDPDDPVQIAYENSDQAVKELIEVLTMCIVEINQEYQECLKSQIEVTETCMRLGPLAEHWDTVTQYRVQAADLKNELVRYEELVAGLGQMVYNQAMSSYTMGNIDGMSLFAEEYEKLEHVLESTKKESQYLEQKLLLVNAESIKHCGR